MGSAGLIAFTLQRRATARTVSAFEASGWLESA
jgi:hypothetical protein